ncbi:GntP family permease [Anaerobranca gottschalkii]|uniref:Predicted D-glycerate permease n=1 Tax=Anaerobranca gottschalkii DSM 13577 TaxID=1120990 RepID=A0A1I0ASV7_9FIRM|nr:GntP family permease [Anaerobranca gottschalkii]SES97262.1 predicted D-glycerate permease [Anaerobranca gottschalkii DSM 13577]
MLEGPILLGVLLLGILFIVFTTSKFKLHPFLALIFAAYLIAFSVKMPLNQIGATINAGFGGTLTGIGIVIIAGTIIGTILEKSGAAITMAETILKYVGKKRPALAMNLIGFIVSIPVFCDSGYVILSSLNKSLAKRTKNSLVVMSVALATGLFATHTLVPPTPGPIAAAEQLGIVDNLLIVILFGLLCAIPATLAGYFYAVKFCNKYKIANEESEIDQSESLEVAATIEHSFEKLPSPLLAFSPIVLPIILLTLGSIANLPMAPFGEGTLKTILAFLGVPVNALIIGVLSSFALLPNFKEETLTGWIGEGVKGAAVIIMITGAGGALGQVLRATPITAYLGETLSNLNIGIFVPFIIAAALKTAQGSSTVALVTTAAIIAPIIEPLGLTTTIAKALTVMSIGAGAMTVSHANDSYFWVVAQFSGMDVKTAYKTQTVATLLQGLVTISVVWVLSLILI